MRIDVDQSGRVDKAGITILAFSNDISYAIKVPSRVRDAGREVLKEKGISSKLIDPLLWSGCVFLLLRDHLDQIGKEAHELVIDNEFDGHQDSIKASLLRHIRKYHGKFPEQKIRVDSITKNSAAHKKALAVKRGRTDKPDRTINVEEIIRLLK